MNLFKNIHIFFATIFVFAIIGLLYLIPSNIDFLNPISQAIGDFEITDIVFSKIRKEQLPDTQIVVVNIGNLSRNKIAEQIKKIHTQEPAVIAMDVFFRNEKEPEQDDSLEKALSRIKNLVMVSELTQLNTQTGSFGNLSGSHAKFLKNASTGFANLVSEPGTFRTIRRFLPTLKVKNKNELSFPVKVTALFNPEKTNKFLHRGYETELINYRGNFRHFYFLDALQVLDTLTKLDFIRGKIVLMGFINPDEESRTFEDVMFTPLNERFAGKTFPDMYGMVIHANIISMILNESYIYELPVWSSIVFAFVMGYFNIALFAWYYKRFKKTYDVFTKLTQLIECLFLLLGVALFFNYMDFKLNLSLTVVVVIFSGDLLEFYFGMIEMEFVLNTKEKIKHIFSKKKN